MPARLRIDGSDNVVIEFEGRMDGEALSRCREACDRVPQLWWKDVTVVLDSADMLDPQVLELLQDLSARASRFRLKRSDESRKDARV